jgi:YD repeat-containing protein
MRADGTLRTAQLTRDPIGRVVRATIEGAAHAFRYDAAGQLVGADTQLGSYEFAYDANGRLARESSPVGFRSMSTTLPGSWPCGWVSAVR